MNEVTAQNNIPVDPVGQFRSDLAHNMKRLKALLPDYIPVERFCSVSIIAVQNNPELLDADRQTLLNELMKCASDGLISDNREATLQIYNSKVKINGRDQWVKKIQYMPMVRGIIKKIRKDTSISEIIVDTVYEKDHFEIFSGDRNEIVHKPNMLSDRGEFVCAYAIFKYKDGKRHQEVMRDEDVRKAMNVAKTKNVWNEWFDEKAKSSVLHRAEKRLDMPHEVHQFMQSTLQADLAEWPRHIEDAPKAPASNIEEALEDYRKSKNQSAQIEHKPSQEIPDIPLDKEPEKVPVEVAPKEEPKLDAFPGCETCGGRGVVESEEEDPFTGEITQSNGLCPECSKK